MVDLTFKGQPLSTGTSESQIFCNVSSLDINLPNSRVKILNFFEIFNGNYANRPFFGRLDLWGWNLSGRGLLSCALLCRENFDLVFS